MPEPRVNDSERAEREWIRLAQQGDQTAYGALMRRHQDRVYRHLLHLTGSREDALELAQEVFIKAWEALPEWRPDAQFHTWLYRIASNLAFDMLRRRKVVQFVALEEDYDAPAESAGPEARLEAKQKVLALDAALARLTPEQRAILLLREVEGLSYGELAASLAIDEGTVKSRLARARGALAALVTGKTNE
jgi:RNA polymerase sigma factor (sigma-70 family)